MCLFVHPIKVVCPGTMILFYSTLMSLAQITVVHPGTDPLGLPSWGCTLGGTVSGYSTGIQIVDTIIIILLVCTIIVLVCTVWMEMTFLALLFYILKYLLHRSTTYTDVTQSSMQWLVKPKGCS